MIPTAVAARLAPRAVILVCSLLLVVPGVRAAEPAVGLALDMVIVPAGSFVMGSPSGEWQSRVDEAQHQVRISQPFLMSRHEITQRQWSLVMPGNPSYLDICPECPVERVTWFEAVAFCNALSQREGLEPVYAVDSGQVIWNSRSNGYRLPTEAEWEYACRGGSRSAFATGPCLSTDQANFMGYQVNPRCSAGLWRGQAVPVGSFPANAFGLHDMHGNVAEWVWDWYGPYPVEPASDPRGPESGRARVFRGGGYDHRDPFCRSACRPSLAPNRATRFVGLRIARNAP